MQIKNLVKLTLISALFISTHISAAEVFTWKNKNGTNAYADAPRNLQPASVNVIDVRTHTVIPKPSTNNPDNAPKSLAEQQKKLSDQIAEQNRQVEEQNKRVEQQNQQQKEANCKTARMNLQFAQASRVPNRDDLLKRYNEDIANFCN